MTIDEVGVLLDRIKAYRPFFMENLSPSQKSFLKKEWFKVLKDYDCKEVNFKLDEYLKNSDNFGKTPDAYYLTKYLHTKEEKLKTGTNYVRCQLCQKVIDLNEYDKHYDRCSSIDYLCRQSSMYSKSKLSKEELWKLEEPEFWKRYWTVCDGLKSISQNEIEKHNLENAIRTHLGQPPKYSVSEILKEMSP